MTGVIYLVIIALWAAVLIPMWLRRHDQISEIRSTARFSSAMHSLGIQEQDASEHSARTRRTASYPVARNTAASVAARRRAVVLAALTALLAFALIGYLLDSAPVWLPLAAAVLVTAFLVASAMTASTRSATMAPARERSVARRRPSARPAPVAAATQDDWETWNAWDDEDAWEPVPETLPTYVSAPVASATPRPNEHAVGEWNGQAMVEAARAMRREAELAAFAEMDESTGDPDGMFDGRSGVDARTDVHIAARDVTAEIPVIPYTDRRVVGA